MSDILKSPKYEMTSGLRLYDKAGKPVDKDATNPVLTISVSAALLLNFCSVGARNCCTVAFLSVLSNTIARGQALLLFEDTSTVVREHTVPDRSEFCIDCLALV